MSIAILGNDAPVLDPESNQWINVKHQRIAEIINDFDPTLHLLWIPPATRDFTDTKPYAVAQIRAEGDAPYIIFYLSEDQLDHRIIARLFESRRMADGNVGSLAQRLDDLDRAQEMVKQKENLEASEIAADKAKFLWKTHKHTVKMGGKTFRL